MHGLVVGQRCRRDRSRFRIPPAPFTNILNFSNIVTSNIVTPNIVTSNIVTPNIVTSNIVTPNIVTSNIVTLINIFGARKRAITYGICETRFWEPI